jgi:tetratricopeptide (TPR) repeat protein
MDGTTLLRQARDQRGLKQSQVVDRIVAIGRRLDEQVAARSSLAIMISQWENGRRMPEPPYRRIFREIYGKTNEELGFPSEPAADALDELADRLVVAKRVDAEMVELFKRQTDLMRHSDRRFGSAVWLSKLRDHIAEVDTLLRHSTNVGQREALAAVLTDASTLAGWNALDAGSIRMAWDHHEAAKAAAREANSPALLAHATAQQAFILTEIGNTTDALALLEHARSIAGEHTPRLLRAWLAAAAGEGHAAAGDRDAALRAFDAAKALLPSETTHPQLAFLFLGGTHLDRWRGNALASLGEPEAIDQLTRVLKAGTGDFVRATAGVHVDLAFAYARAGDRDAARRHAQQARRIISQVGSVKLRRRLERLKLPDGRSSVA